MQPGKRNRISTVSIGAAIAAAVVAYGASNAGATPTASATITSAADGADSQYSIVLNNISATPATSVNAIGTFWFAWTPGKDFLQTSPLSITQPTGWKSTITHAGSTDGFAIQWVTTTAGSDLAAGSSLGGFGFTTADSPSSVFSTSAFYPTTPTLTSFAYEGAPFSDAGDQFIVNTPEPSAIALIAIGAGLMLKRRRSW